MNWKKLDQLPDGWHIDKTCGSPSAGYSFATNGRSVLNGGLRALVRQAATQVPDVDYAQFMPKTVQNPVQNNVQVTVEARRAMNDLARAKFKEMFLKDLTMDLMICKIEGWDAAEYIAEIHALVDNVHESIKPAQGKLFS